MLFDRIPRATLHCAALLIVGMMLVAAGQPIFSDDAWIHLALGKSYWALGPWLAEDPLLFTADRAPVPAAWLFDTGLHGLLQVGGFPLIRLFHVGVVAAILGLLWSLVRRASRSATLASLGVASFVVLSAYRLVQLRPHLLSILLALVLYRLVIELRPTGEPASPSPLRCALAIALMACWANLHAAFLLGPLIVAGALLGVLIDGVLRGAARFDRKRATTLAIVAALGFLATFLNPAVAEPHLAWFISGTDTPSLGRVSDDWAHVNPFALPLPSLPPAPLTWALYWVLLVATPLAAMRAISRRNFQDEEGWDPATLALGLGALLAPIVAVRFLWLTVFPLLLIARTFRHGGSASLRGWPGAVTALALVPAFAWFGAWPMISKGLAGGLTSYAQPYPASKYFAHTTWFLADAGLRGNLYNDYYMGGFLGFWLAPEIKTFISGTLNLRPDAMAANDPLRRRAGVRGEDGPRGSFLGLLDQQEVDLFLGIHLPETGNPNRPWYATTAHLERSEGWIPVFRNARSAVYLRDNRRNAENLERVRSYYREAGVPFDPKIGFDPVAAASASPRWAIAHGVAPVSYRQWLRSSDERGTKAFGALSHLAAWYTALGAYEVARKADARLLAIRPKATGPQRRTAWRALRLGNLDEASALTSTMREGEDPLSQNIARVANELASPAAAVGSEDQVRERTSRVPVFSRAEAKRLMQNYSGPAARSP